MTAAALKTLFDERTQFLSLSVEQYHDVLAAGVLVDGDPYELLDGCVVHKDRSAVGGNGMTVGVEHAWAVHNLTRLDARLGRLGCHMRTQQPITLPPNNEPEPDGAIVRGGGDDYREHHPRAKDVCCAIEVSDASLRLDRTVKLQIYARAGIPGYVIINLIDRTIEAYAKPARRSGRYRESVTLRPGERVSFPTENRPLTVPVNRLLP